MGTSDSRPRGFFAHWCPRKSWRREDVMESSGWYSLHGGDLKFNIRHPNLIQQNCVLSGQLWFSKSADWYKVNFVLLWIMWNQLQVARDKSQGSCGGWWCMLGIPGVPTVFSSRSLKVMTRADSAHCHIPSGYLLSPPEL